MARRRLPRDARGEFKGPHHDGQVRTLERKFALFQTGHSVCPAAIFDPLFAALVLNHQLEIVYGTPKRTKVVEPLCLAVYRDVLYLRYGHLSVAKSLSLATGHPVSSVFLADFLSR